MSNIVDAFSITALYNSIMKDCTESLMGAIPWGFLYAPRRRNDAEETEASVFLPRLSKAN